MLILQPIAITAEMLGAGTTVAEPAPGELEWTPSTAYTVGMQRIRPQTHRVYSCVKDHSGSTVAPEDDPLNWYDEGPTQRWAPFDYYTSTVAKAAGSMSFVINPGYFIRDVALYGMAGDVVELTYRDAPGGSVVHHVEQSLFRDAPGLYEYLVMPPRRLTKLLVTDLPLVPAGELTVTLTGESVEIGMITVGHFVSITEGATRSGTEFGAVATPKTNSYFSFKDDRVTIKKRGRGRDLDLPVVMDRAVAAQAAQLVEDVLDVPVAVVATRTPGFEGLNTFGLITSGPVTIENANTARMRVKVQGMY